MITTTVSLSYNNSVVATSCVKCNPTNLIRCYANMLNNPCIDEITIKVEIDFDYAFSKGLFMENSEYTIGGNSFDADWCAENEWIGVENNDVNKVVDWVIKNINSTFKALA